MYSYIYIYIYIYIYTYAHVVFWTATRGKDVEASLTGVAALSMGALRPCPLIMFTGRALPANLGGSP